MSESRPKYLDLFKIRLPVPGLVSILHRISGLGLFLFLPFLLWLFQSSLASPDSYVRYRAAFANPLVKLILIGLLWAFLHHLLAGLRFLALDLHYGADLATARASSRVVLLAAIALTVILGVWLW
ncbi:MAG TPA: succinate dehydrogenase, cytochrome b556 subunit [Burkholderiales bacterium]|nr:succinate dehydrogenase, cytochrome b556 subunit [Burkholderiales bacterium]